MRTRDLVAAGTLAVSLLAAGCSAGPKPQGAEASRYELTSTTPPATGEVDTVKWGIAESEPESLDWIYDWDYGAGNQLASNLCEGLRRQNPDGSLGWALATGVRTPDPTTLVYTIRQGVKFTDGKPMTAKDVAFSLNRNVTASPASYWGLWYENVQSIEATSPTEVTVRFKSPDSLFDSVMGTPAGYVGEQEYIEAKGKAYGTPGGGVMCTGPFSLDQWEQGRSLVLKRNQDYWDTQLKPKAKSFQFSFVPDSTAMTSALQTGELDGAWSVSISSLKSLQSSKTGKVYVNEGTEVAVIQIATLDGALKDPRIRKALRTAIDYDGIVRGVLGDAGRPATTTTPESVWGKGDVRAVYEREFAKLAPAKQDLEQAKKLVTEAGTPAQPIVLAVSADFPELVNAATSVQASAVQIGLKVEIKKMPQNTFVNLFFDEKARAGLDGMINNVTADVPDPLELVIQVRPGSPYNYAKIDTPAFAEPLALAATTADPVKRADLTAQAITAFADNVYSFPIYAVYSRVFLNNRITGVPVESLVQWYYPWAATVGSK
ncbi:peptide/nickel transport system substrate-binding protein [Kibdelosporangium banguiense]|uniref:Peptide/nickel transport system substrate-binding protein n=1 Tax=Kibdelosporangium banguiense TaxID=1365924 RepID=A0ABS4TS26_9PSEU|nr:ABC transporter substrate-binding protein [Kibdelosporangium banguiense]MBP2327209.1 peptide/nickel transport system substrate-binding protein [Kibdelosporangium banguiense]